MKHLGLALILAVSPLIVWAGTGYKWTDAEGNVHFTQEPPPPDAQVQDTFSLPQAAPPEAPPAEQAPSEETPAAPKTDAPLEDLSGMTSEQLAERNCQRAQNYLKSLQVEGDVVMESEDGKLEKLDETRRKTEIERGQKLVEQYCSAPPAEAE